VVSLTVRQQHAQPVASLQVASPASVATTTPAAHPVQRVTASATVAIPSAPRCGVVKAHRAAPKVAPQAVRLRAAIHAEIADRPRAFQIKNAGLCPAFFLLMVILVAQSRTSGGVAETGCKRYRPPHSESENRSAISPDSCAMPLEQEVTTSGQTASKAPVGASGFERPR
jgi:hypothetical protein